jgi:outer membrane receptor protein involved in Fe transport
MLTLRYSARVRLILLCLFLVLPGVAQGAQRGTQLTGVVLDSSGAPIAGAAVNVGEATVRTGADGTFALTVPPGQLQVRVTAEGFGPATVPAAESAERVRVVLQPAPIEDRVLVTAARGVERLGTAGSQTTVTSAELLSAGAGSLDDALRATPGFSLFRRSSSRVSNPTTQGVTLRGVFGSGASRTLVLADGVPLNDPFGSWVYWNRVPQAAIDRVEIVRGATGDLYGADALGGVIQVLTFAPGTPRVRFTAEGGSLDTAKISGFANAQRNGWFGEAAVEWTRTDGYITVGEEVRGPVDVRAESDYQTGFFGGGYNAGAWHASARVSLYDEERGNGTPVQVNTTDWKQLAGEAGGTAGGGAWQVRAAGGTQDYYQTFSAILGGAARTGERLTTRQTTPSRFASGSGQWARELGRVALLVGAEGRRTRSTVEELRYSFTNVESGPFVAGGTEVNGALFGRVSFMPTDQLTIVAGARGDVWRSEPREDDEDRHEAEFLSPRVSIGWRLSEGVSIHAAGYRSHRTPTLNELYRGFRVGLIDTLANPQLDPETLTGGEAGLLFSRNVVSTRVTVFANQLENAVTNVTIGTNLRQRQNTDTIRATGVEVETSVRPHARWTIGGLVAVTRSRFHETPAQPEIEGNRVPQVPTFQVGGTLTYADPVGLTASLQARAFGAQYDDDLNELELGEYGVVDFSASQQLRRGLNVFVAVENLFDQDYDVGRTPLRTIGWPRTARAGVRVFLP